MQGVARAAGSPCAIVVPMDEKTLQLLVDLHRNNRRQGPGSDDAFQEMLILSRMDVGAPLKIADIGCGTGSSTIPLLGATNAQVTAVDAVPEFLETLKTKAQDLGLGDRLTTVEADMNGLPFQEQQFDAIWAEGAIYNIGFKQGIMGWKRFLKSGGVVVVSEITWLRSDIPNELRTHWESEYPEIDLASNKLALLEQNGYVPIGYFTLTPNCWLDEYYLPLQLSLEGFLQRNADHLQAKEIADAEQREYELYQRYQDYYSYGVYIAKKI